jgi:antitoxin CptB
MTDEMDIRRRRAAYRAHHRGTKEMDILIGQFADRHLPDFSEGELSRFERFLAMPDPTLQSWIFSGQGCDSADFAALVREIRIFHHLEDAQAAHG